MSEDTIQVRPDEQFDEEKLADYLRGQLSGSENPLTVRQFGGGAANLTYLLDYGTHEYVLRRPPLGPVAKSAHDMSREYRVLSRLYQAFPYAPRAFLYCEGSRRNRGELFCDGAAAGRGGAPFPAAGICRDTGRAPPHE